MNLEHHHVGLPVTDLDAARKRHADVLTLGFGHIAFRVSDPDGNLVEFISAVTGAA